MGFKANPGTHAEEFIFKNQKTTFISKSTSS
jgi:hypothetical protein